MKLPASNTAGLMSAVLSNATGRRNLTTLPPLSLYIHLPWCLKKCPYCDFNSHEFAGDKTGSALPEAQYIDCLERDLEAALPDIWGRAIQSVFIGGGTPSLFSADGIGQILRSARTRIKIAPDAEVTMEANPGTFELERFAGFAQAGVNRLSIGVQSFNDEHLKKLGRVHDSSQALLAARCASEFYSTWNLDIMYGLPDQNLAQACADIDQAIGLNPPHISLYNLTLEPNTLFAKFPPKLPDDDLIALMQESLEAKLQTAGYLRYEVSAWAKVGQQSRHNRNYWEFGDYLGIGAGAHSKLSFHDRIERQVRVRTPADYQRLALLGQAVSQRDIVQTDDLPFEFMLNALRLVDGAPQSLFEERTGLSVLAIQEPIKLALKKGLLDEDIGVFKASELGLRFLNDLQELFLNAPK